MLHRTGVAHASAWWGPSGEGSKQLNLYQVLGDIQSDVRDINTRLDTVETIVQEVKKDVGEIKRFVTPTDMWSALGWMLMALVAIGWFVVLLLIYLKMG